MDPARTTLSVTFDRPMDPQCRSWIVEHPATAPRLGDARWDAAHQSGTAQVALEPGHDYARYNLMDPIVEPHALTLAEVDAAIAACYRDFFMGNMADFGKYPDAFRRNDMLCSTKLIMKASFLVKKSAASRCLACTTGRALRLPGRRAPRPTGDGSPA